MSFQSWDWFMLLGQIHARRHCGNPKWKNCISTSLSVRLSSVNPPSIRWCLVECLNVLQWFFSKCNCCHLLVYLLAAAPTWAAQLQPPLFEVYKEIKQRNHTFNAACCLHTLWRNLCTDTLQRNVNQTSPLVFCGPSYQSAFCSLGLVIKWCAM